MKLQEVADLRREQQAMLANVDEIERAYQDRAADLPVDAELEQWLADTRQAVADQQEWLSQLQSDLVERQGYRRKSLFSIVVLLIALLGVIVFS